MKKTNKGKKYVRLTGYEIPTDENLKRAAAFLEWYALNVADLESRVRKNRNHPGSYCPDLMADTMLGIYDAVALKGLDVKDYRFYFYRSYYNLYLGERKKVKPGYLDDVVTGEDLTLSDVLAAPLNNSAEYELAVDRLQSEILDYVRAYYDPVASSHFEIYIGLQPDTSYKRIAALLGVPFNLVWTSIGAIRKDVAQVFAAERGNLLSTF